MTELNKKLTESEFLNNIKSVIITNFEITQTYVNKIPQTSTEINKNITSIDVKISYYQGISKNNENTIEIKDIELESLLKDIENGFKAKKNNIVIAVLYNDILNNTNILKKLNKERKENNSTLVFLNEVNFSDEIVEEGADFNNAIFKEKANFDFAEFKEKANFDFAEFKGEASFDGAKFKGVAHFVFAQFEGKANFGSAKFEGVAIFWDAEFKRLAIFWDAQFKEDASFKRAQFKGEANFGSEQFNFKSAQFEGEANFTSALFERVANFFDAKFKGVADFFDAKFKGVANFYKAQFERKAIFWDAEFKGLAIFWDAQFEGVASFDEALFERKTIFWMAKFEGEANFGSAQFKEEARFWGAQFEVEANFKSAQFKGEASFNSALFKGVASFDKAQFKEEASFRSIKVNYTQATKINFNSSTFSGNLDLRDIDNIDTATINLNNAIINLYSSTIKGSLYLSGSKINTINLEDSFIENIIANSKTDITNADSSDTWRLLKANAIKNHHQVLAWHYKTKEFEALQNKEDPGYKYLQKNRSTKFIVWFNQITNNHGSSLLLPILWFVFVLFLGSFLENLFIETNISYKYFIMNIYMFFNVCTIILLFFISIIIWIFEIKTIIIWIFETKRLRIGLLILNICLFFIVSIFNKNIFNHMFNYLPFVYKNSDNCDNTDKICLIDSLNNSLIAQGLHIVFSILLAILVWQIVQSARKFKDI